MNVVTISWERSEHNCMDTGGCIYWIIKVDNHRICLVEKFDLDAEARNIAYALRVAGVAVRFAGVERIEPPIMREVPIEEI